uniref:Uncharacterized protein n=1 Tax=Pseudomonas marincola TaxID=437900 RepID=A0A653E5H3_9PSED
MHDRRQCNHRLALHVRDHQSTVGDGKVAFAGEHAVDGLGRIRPTLNDIHIHAGLAIEAFFLGHVIAGKLKLVQPAELQANRFCSGERRCQTTEQDCCDNQQIPELGRSAEAAYRAHGFLSQSASVEYWCAVCHQMGII